jgi:hypothetical protein
MTELVTHSLQDGSGLRLLPTLPPLSSGALE